MAARTGLAPIVDRYTEVLILGSFPSDASLAQNAYYAHPRNQFWRILEPITGLDLQAADYRARVAGLLGQRIGLWDVLASCERSGSLDAAIRKPVANDFSSLLWSSPNLSIVLLNGGTAARFARGKLPAALRVCQVPSSSPAHAALPLGAKRTAWQAALTRAASDDL